MRVYDIYDAPRGKLSPQSNNYDRVSRRVIKVAAVSLKQALHMAYSRTWTDGTSPGIAAIKDSEGKWKVYTGTTEWNVPWEHYRTFKPIK